MTAALTVQPMRLKSLSIERKEWGECEGQYFGKIRFDGPSGAIDVVLPPELATEYLRVSSEILARVSTQAAAVLQRDIEASVQDALALNLKSQPIAITP